MAVGSQILESRQEQLYSGSQMGVVMEFLAGTLKAWRSGGLEERRAQTGRKARSPDGQEIQMNDEEAQRDTEPERQRAQRQEPEGTQV